MAVQKKTSKTSETKEKKEINWMQVCVVGFCILVVAMCIFSFANFQNFFRDNNTNVNGQNVAAEIGYPVIVDYTMKIGDTETYKNMRMPLYAGSTVTSTQYFTDSNGNTYAMQAEEFNAISQGVLGHVPGDKFTVQGPGGENHISYINKEDIEALGSKYDDVNVGTVLNTTMEYTDDDGKAQKATVLAVVTEKYDNLVKVQYAADTIDVNFAGYYATA
ncbi:MAG TPA: hypothetical protein O0X39_06500 [Methanocorpusculum sp.]|nr:hypothetical protein [Methanocorpusculum sp.]